MEPEIKDIIAYEYKLDSAYSRGILNKSLGELLQTVKMPLPEQYLGVEIEVEHIPYPDRIRERCDYSFYHITNDGSLRNNGVEIITKPTQARCIETLLRAIYAALPQKADFSPRTSIHVHMNIRDLTFSELTGVIYTYIAVEKLLYNFVGTGRNKSIFCVPIQETDLPMCLPNFLGTKNTRHLGWFKYTGMNLLPISKLGTIEFRHLHGTHDVGLILKWISILQHIFAYAKNNKVEKITENLLSINTTSAYRVFVEEIFKELTPDLLYSNFDRDLEQGVSYLKTYVFQNKFLGELVDISTKASPLFKRLYKNDTVPLKKTTGFFTGVPQLINDPAEITDVVVTAGDGGGGQGIVGTNLTAAAKKKKASVQAAINQHIQNQLIWNTQPTTFFTETEASTTTNGNNEF